MTTINPSTLLHIQATAGAQNNRPVSGVNRQVAQAAPAPAQAATSAPTAGHLGNNLDIMV